MPDQYAAEPAAVPLAIEPVTERVGWLTGRGPVTDPTA